MSTIRQSLKREFWRQDEHKVRVRKGRGWGWGWTVKLGRGGPAPAPRLSPIQPRDALGRLAVLWAR